MREFPSYLRPKTGVFLHRVDDDGNVSEKADVYVSRAHILEVIDFSQADPAAYQWHDELTLKHETGTELVFIEDSHYAHEVFDPENPLPKRVKRFNNGGVAFRTRRNRTARYEHGDLVGV